ncbi:MAG: oligoendopeptidase F [Fusobacteriia bacterium 4572_132]|nr:MAG: oligoendopeptidase F [Fusobacteriia bacterium 4572_132]
MKKIIKKKRKYFSEDFKIDQWKSLEIELKKIEDKEIKNVKLLEEIIRKNTEIGNIISETMAKKYIAMTCNANNPKYAEDFNKFYAEIISKVELYSFKIKKKIIENKYFNELDLEKYSHLKKILKNEIELFREENIPLFVKEQELSNKYGEYFSKLTVEFEGKKQTLTQMAKYNKNPNRELREKAWRLVFEKLEESKNEFEELFDELKKIRILIAKNAGFDNYRDYIHKAKGRFSYTVEDIFEFHNSVKETVLPILKDIHENRAKKLKLEKLRPWDMLIDLDGKILKPFETSEELINKSINVLNQVDEDFGEKLKLMQNTKLLDLENREGKAPGGYNYPLSETGAAFIFMNSIGLHSDVTTLLHESGHAMHSFATANIEIGEYAEMPSEIAELASMSMELITLDYLNEYYKDIEDVKKAKKEQLERTLDILPWVMIVDKFQQWIYTNPNHISDERDAYFNSLMEEFGTGTDWNDLEKYRKIAWLKQLHIFEVPFYYIEYSISQLGAIAIYKNYKENKEKTIENYKEFLKLGYSKDMKTVYETAGIKFDFSKQYIEELVEFIKGELDKLQ